MRCEKTDVLVIGSGFGGAAPALRLSEGGARVLMLEKGPEIVPARDFRQSLDPRYLLRYIKGLGGRNVNFTYAEGLGGGSGFYELVSLRAPSLAFGLRTPRGRRHWPADLDRAELDPHYSVAERMLNADQIAPGKLPQSGIVFSRLLKNLGYTCERARHAVVHCRGDGYCAGGCVFGAKQDLLGSYLPRAREAGLEIRTDCEALAIRTCAGVRAGPRGRARLTDLPLRYEVDCRDRKSGSRTTVATRLLILAGGTVGTARLLLDSAEALPRLSNQVGRNISTNGGVKAAGLLPPGFPDGDMFRGPSHAGVISYEFLASRGITISSHKPLPLFAIAAARLVRAGETRQPAYWGQAHLDLMKSYRRRVAITYALGLTQPSATIRRRDDGSFSVREDLDDDLRRYRRRTRELLDSLFIRNGGTVLEPTFVDREGQPRGEFYLSTGHMVGSARMADNRRHGVVDRWGEIFGYPGVHVTDGAAIPTSLAVNTSLTILANAERVARHLCRKHLI